jgi:hypothetical protein
MKSLPKRANISMSKENDTVPFKWGDRIDHAKFGLGTVNGEPRAVSGASSDLRRIEPKGWTVPVKWDEASRGATQISSSHLKLVDRPNAKGGAYWNHEFQKLADEVRNARKETDLALTNVFRPVGGEGLSTLRTRLEAEHEQLSRLLRFVEEDERGDHP